MRFSVVLLLMLMLPACGKTGALFLPEEAPEPKEQEKQEASAETTTEENAD
jgi:predicted small lipoprotein YifL